MVTDPWLALKARGMRKALRFWAYPPCAHNTAAKINLRERYILLRCHLQLSRLLLRMRNMFSLVPRLSSRANETWMEGFQGGGACSILSEPLMLLFFCVITVFHLLIATFPPVSPPYSNEPLNQLATCNAKIVALVAVYIMHALSNLILWRGERKLYLF